MDRHPIQSEYQSDVFHWQSSLQDMITILNAMMSDEPGIPEDIQILIVRVLSEVETCLGRENLSMEYQAQLALSNIANNDLTEYKIVDQDASEV